MLTMNLTLRRTIIVLALSLLASASPQTQMRAGSYVIGAVDDWEFSGNYRIYSCSTRASQVKKLLDLTYLYLQTALLSTNTPAYKAFFRSADPATVQNVLRAMTAGIEIQTLNHGQKQPTLVCVNREDPGILTFWDLCDHAAGPMVIQPPETALIFLCPIFFDRDVAPQATDCGTVNRADTKLITRSYILGTQYGFLVQALADMYIRERMPGVKVLRGEWQTDNDYLALPPDQSVRTSKSYSYYVSSKL